MPKKFESDEESRAYNRNHYRIVRSLGKASEYECDCECGRPAAEWAQIHGKDGTEDEHFFSLCRPCHQKYDNRWNKAEREKLSKTLKSNGHRPPSALGRTRSEETKAKMGEAQRKRFAEFGHHRTGTHHTEDAKARISASNKATKARQKGVAL